MTSVVEQIDWKQFGVITEDTSVNEYLVVYIVSTLIFTVFYFLNKMFLPGVMRTIFGEKGAFFSLSEKGRNDYCSRNVADLHSLISGPLAIYCSFFACDD